MCTKAKVVVYVLALCVRRRFRRRRRRRPTFAPRRRSSQAAGQALRTRRLRHHLLNHHLPVFLRLQRLLFLRARFAKTFFYYSPRRVSLYSTAPTTMAYIYVCVYIFERYSYFSSSSSYYYRVIVLLRDYIIQQRLCPTRRKNLFLFVPSLKFFVFLFFCLLLPLLFSSCSFGITRIHWQC